MNPLSITALRNAYGAGKLTPLKLAQDVLARIAAADPAIFISRVPEESLVARAKALMSGPQDLPLYGVPFAVKDNIDVAGLPTTAACPEFSYLPERSAFVVRKLEEAGAMLVGKTNMDQFATGLVGTRSPYGAPRSIFSRDHVSGGSSSGSAVAVAAKLCSFALGTDTAGSGRVPASFNGITGLKPTRGRISAAGVVPACKSLDCVSIFGTTPADAMRVLEVSEGFDAGDIYSRTALNMPLPPDFRFGVLAPHDRSFDHEDGDALYQSAISRLEALGGTPVPFDYAPFLEVAKLLYQGPWVAERLAAIQDFAHHKPGAMDPVVREIILGANRFSAVDAFEGQYRLQALKRQTDTAWAGMDVMLLPTTPGHPTIAEVAAAPIAANARLGHYTNFVNFLDCCAVAVPAGFKKAGLPFGVTLVAPAFHDLALARMAGQFANGEP